MKVSIKVLSLVLIAFAAFVVSSCSSKKEEVAPGTVLKVAADSVPHAEILEFIKPQLEKEGIDLQIYVTSEWTLINTQTQEGQYDANYFQHLPFLESAKVGRDLDLIPVGAVHIEPISLYSHKYKSVAELPEKAIIAVPNDPANEYRALVLLQELGFIKLRDSISTYQASKADIVQYLKPIQIVEADGGLIVRSGDQFDAYITNTNRILEYGVKDPILATENPKDSPYANLLVVRKDRENDPAIKALVRALRTQDVKDFINDKYNGAVVAAF
jgi:D-methionine transport system substrate-binding protein